VQSLGKSMVRRKNPIEPPSMVQVYFNLIINLEDHHKNLSIAFTWLAKIRPLYCQTRSISHPNENLEINQWRIFYPFRHV
jgi:hypothetical protein